MSDQPSPFLALQHRNFRLLWAGQGISIAGTMMQSAAVLWHVSLLVPSDQRGLALGLVGIYIKLPTTSAAWRNTGCRRSCGRRLSTR